MMSKIGPPTKEGGVPRRGSRSLVLAYPGSSAPNISSPFEKPMAVAMAAVNQMNRYGRV